MKPEARPSAPEFAAHIPIEQVCSLPRVLLACRELGVVTVADYLRRDQSEFLAVRNFGPRSYASLDRAVQTWLEHNGHGRHEESSSPTPRAGELMQLLEGLDTEQAELVRLRLGLSGTPLNVPHLAAHLSCTPLEARGRIAAVHRRIHEHRAPAINTLHEEGRRWVDSHDGVGTPDQLACGTLLHSAAAQDPGLPARLLCFCFPDEFFALADALTCTSPRALAATRTALRRWSRQRRFPVAMTDLYRLVGEGKYSVPWGVVRHLLQHFGLTVSHDRIRGYLVATRPGAVVDRVEEILRESDAPMAVDDLVFHYRDRYHSCHKGRLLARLRADPRMLQLAPQLWTLRERHCADLEAMSDRAREVAQLIQRLGGRQNVKRLVADRSMSETELHLLLARLRLDPTLRNLGRGEFCPRDQRMSGVMQRICDDLRRAMGELPVWRFLENQEVSGRAVIECLLRENRLFVEPCEHRIDLLTNYPFNGERLQRLCELVDQHLTECGSYTTLTEILDCVQKTELGGNYLSEHLLGDLLRRHGPFEILPGGVVARADLGLGGWIQQKAREVLRHADLPLTPGEIVGEVPELGEFTACLQELLERDPLVESNDAMHYRVV